MNVLAYLVGLTLCAVVLGENSEKSEFPPDMKFLARSLRDKIMAKREFCSKYGQQCGIFISCCGAMECHYYDNYSGKCKSNK